MRRIGGTLAAAAVMLLAVACGQQEEVGFGGSPAASSTEQPVSTVPIPPDQQPDPMNPAPPAGAQAVPAPKVDGSALPEGYPKIAWTEGDGASLGAYGVASGGCTEVTAELAEQNPQRVVLNIIETTTAGGACTMEIRYPPVSVKLAEPLGDRTVVLQRTAQQK